MKKNRIEILLEDMTYNSKFEILEEAKHKDELADIAKKRGIVLPAHDLAVFKCTYAFVDRMNLNGCNLPKEEVEKSLETLVGKAIDFDHFRKSVVGFWIDSKIKKDEIIAYGIFFKGNFEEDYETVKDLMKNDTLAISFEAYGDRENVNEKGEYDLTNIEWAGGALLLKTSPAFPGSQVTEMSNKRVLEFAKVMIAPDKFVHSGEKKKEVVIKTEDNKLPELARFHIYDTENISRLISEVDCLNCKEKGFSDILAIDFEKNSSRIRCLSCEAEMILMLTPSAKLTKKGRKIKEIQEAMPDKIATVDADPVFMSMNLKDYSKSEITNLKVFLSQDEEIETARYDSYDMDVIMKIIREAEKPKGEEESYPMIESVDFKTQKVRVRYEPSNTIVEIDLSVKPKTKRINSSAEKLTVEERNKLSDDLFAVIINTKGTDNKDITIRKYPIDIPDRVDIALRCLGMSNNQEVLTKLDISIDSVETKILNRAKELNMKKLLEQYEKSSVEELIQSFAKEVVNRELTEEELKKAYTVFEYKKPTGDANDTSLKELDGKSKGNPTSLINAEIDEKKIKAVIKEIAEKIVNSEEEKDMELKDQEIAKLKTELGTAEAKNKELQDKLDAIEQARIAKVIEARKAELGESSKDMTDEDILNDDKFTIAKQAKLIADLQKEKPAEDASKKDTNNKPDLTVASKDKKSETRESNKTVRQLAFEQE